MRCFKQKVLTLANEEDSPYDENLWQRRFLHALETDIRNGNVKNEICTLLKNSTITDEEV